MSDASTSDGAPWARRFDPGHALDVRVLVGVVPIALLAAVVSRAPVDAAAAWTWAAVNVASFAATAAWLFAVRTVLLRAGRGTIGVLAVVVVGASVGLVKGATTSTFGALAGLIGDASDPQEYARAVGTTLQGAILLPAVTLVRSALERYRAAYDQLILERARRMLLTGRSASGEQGARVARFVEEARRRLDDAADPTVAVVLEELVEDRLRPLTRELWERSDATTDFRLASLVRASIRVDANPALPVTVVFVLIAFIARTEYLPLAQNLLVSGLNVVAIIAAFGLSRRLRPASHRFDVVHLLVTVITVAGAVSGVELLLVGSVPQGPDLGATFVIVVLWLLALTVLSSAVLVALRAGGQVDDELEQLLSGELDDAAEDASMRLRDRQVADRLHSIMQNRLIASARRIERSGGSSTVAREEVMAIGRLLDDLASGSAEPPVSVREQVAQLAARWDGFVTIEARLDPSLDASPLVVQERIAQATAEAVNNATRHGRAAWVRVVIEPAEGGWRLIAEDDGLGPVQRPPGLGSRLFAALSGGTWSLEGRAEGGARLEVAIRTEHE